MPLKTVIKQLRVGKKKLLDGQMHTFSVKKRMFKGSFQILKKQEIVW